MARNDVLSSFDRGSEYSVQPTAVGAEGLSIFDGSRGGGFEVKIRGYDKNQVEEHIRQLEQALAYTRAINRQLDKQIAQLRQRLGDRGPLQLPEPADDEEG